MNITQKNGNFGTKVGTKPTQNGSIKTSSQSGSTRADHHAKDVAFNGRYWQAVPEHLYTDKENTQ